MNRRPIIRIPALCLRIMVAVDRRESPKREKETFAAIAAPEINSADLSRRSRRGDNYVVNHKGAIFWIETNACELRCKGKGLKGKRKRPIT